MPLYFISYDIRSLKHDYTPLFGALRTVGARPAQASAWLLETGHSIRSLSDYVRAYLDPDDSLFVIEVAPETAWAATHLTENTGSWLKERRP